MAQHPARRLTASKLLGAAVALGLGSAGLASFHIMEIEQVMVGVNGDLTAQAIQIRFRAVGQNFVSQGRLKCYDAAGANAITLIDFTTNVSNGAAGARVLVTSSAFNAYTSPTAVPNFTMTNLIPSSRVAAGRLTFESDAGIIFWSLSWGGSGYTGSNAGDITNDSNGNFGPPFAGPVPSTGVQALMYTKGLNGSTSNSVDYALTSGPATFINNTGTSFTLIHCDPDFNGDGFLTGDDFDEFVEAFEAGDISADYNGDGFPNGDDFDAYNADFEAGC